MFTPLYQSQSLDQLYSMMIAKKIKCTRERLLFSVQKSTERFIFLERGDDKTGLIHILDGHENQFQQFGIARGQVAQVLENVARDKPILVDMQEDEDNPGQYNYAELYSYNASTAILLARGDNGYIVTAWPVSIETVRALQAAEERVSRCRVNEPRSWMSAGLNDYSPFEDYVEGSKKMLPNRR